MTLPDACLLFRGMADKHYRSLIKGVSWRITGSIDTLIIALFVTRRLNLALGIMSVEFFTKIMLYYFHERVWEKLSFGRIKEPKKDKPSFEI